MAGVGVLLLGRSGIGKSECALELLMRGHRLVADDVVLLDPPAVDGEVWGRSDELVRYYMELRGLGIVHVPSLFGEAGVTECCRIELVVRLEAWGTAEVDRVGIDQQSERIGDVDLPQVRLPVAPGRNVATLVEVAARNHRLRAAGHSGAADLDRRVRQRLGTSRDEDDA